MKRCGRSCCCPENKDSPYSPEKPEFRVGCSCGDRSASKSQFFGFGSDQPCNRSCEISRVHTDTPSAAKCSVLQAQRQRQADHKDFNRRGCVKCQRQVAGYNQNHFYCHDGCERRLECLRRRQSSDEHTEGNPRQKARNCRKVCEDTSPILSHQGNCGQHQTAGYVSRERLSENKSGRVTIPPNEGKSKGKQLVRGMDIGAHRISRSPRVALLHTWSCPPRVDSRPAIVTFIKKCSPHAFVVSRQALDSECVDPMSW